MFMKASERIDKQVKARAKFKGDTEALARFKGEFPASVQRLMNGDGVLPGVGFNKLAMQLAITANALGKTEEQLVEACEGLVQNHSSDSSRYNSPRKRKEELRRMYAYTHDNPLYEYSNGGIKSMCAAGVDTPDLENPMQAHAGMVQGDLSRFCEHAHLWIAEPR
jgi:hypothetical protein